SIAGYGGRSEHGVPGRPPLHEGARVAAPGGQRRRGRHHGLRAGRARRRRLRRGAGGGRHARAGAGGRRGGGPHNGLGSLRASRGAIGAGSIAALCARVPANLRARAAIALPAGLTEPELLRDVGVLAARNAGASGPAVFLGAGAYPHWIPAVVDQILLRSEFATAYTPYQPEVSQGTLQAVFEFQTFVALVLGLEVANASMYDGASATAEAVRMARRLLPGRRTVWIAGRLHPHYRATVATYVRGLDDVELRGIPFGSDGRTDLAALRAGLGPDTLCVVVGQPSVFGVLEDVAPFA